MQPTTLVERALHQALRKIEAVVHRALGKGWAAASLRQEVSQVLRLCPGQLGTVIDCGANVGEWALALTEFRRPEHLILVEPDPGNAAKLRTLFPTATVVEAAISDKDGTATLFSDAPGSVLGSLHQRDLRMLNIDMVAQAIVPTFTLASVLQNANVENVSLLKIDIEGHEFAALSGSVDSLSKIDTIQFEFGGTNIDSKTYFRDFWNILSAMFTIYRLSPTGPVKIYGYSEVEEAFGICNFVCVRKTISQ